MQLITTKKWNHVLGNTHIQHRAQVESTASVGASKCNTPPRLQLVATADMQEIHSNTVDFDFNRHQVE